MQNTQSILNGLISSIGQGRNCAYTAFKIHYPHWFFSWYALVTITPLKESEDVTISIYVNELCKTMMFKTMPTNSYLYEWKLQIKTPQMPRGSDSQLTGNTEYELVLSAKYLWYSRKVVIYSKGERRMGSGSNLLSRWQVVGNKVS